MFAGTGRSRIASEMRSGARHLRGAGTRADAFFTLGSNAGVRALVKHAIKTIRKVLIPGIRSYLASFIFLDIFKNDNLSFRYKNPVRWQGLHNRYIIIKTALSQQPKPPMSLPT